MKKKKYYNPTKAQLSILDGLKLVAKQKLKEIEDFADIIADILQYESINGDYGHISDFLYCDMSTKELLSKMEAEYERNNPND